MSRGLPRGRGAGGRQPAVEPDTRADACLAKGHRRPIGSVGTGFVGIGLPGDCGGTWTLTRLAGTAKARESFVTGDIIGVEEALRIGLVNTVVEDAEPADVTMALLRRFAAMLLAALG
jgi:hypothetical protein